MADAEASLPGHCRESNRINFDVVRAPNQGGLAAWQPARWGGAASLRWPPLKSEAKRGGRLRASRRGQGSVAQVVALHRWRISQLGNPIQTYNLMEFQKEISRESAATNIHSYDTL
jgi:hypothetical protein